MPVEKKILREKAMRVASRFIETMYPYVVKCEIAGGLRRENNEVKNIEIVAVPRLSESINALFHENYKGLVLNGAKLKRFSYPEYDIHIELHLTTMVDYGRILALKTGSSAYVHIALTTTWNRLGWCGTEHGLRRKKECKKSGRSWKLLPEHINNPTMPPIFATEADFYEFMGLTWIPPNERNWKSKYDHLNYSL